MDAVSPADPDKLRASDQDRHQVAERLHAAAAEGRIDLDELGERLEVLYAARTYGELVPLTRDLPAPATGPAVGASVARATSSGVVGPSTSIAVLGSSDRSGEWTVPAQHTAFAMMGGVELDLTRARFAADRVTITAIAIMGGIEITVPHDMEVEIDGFALMGGFERKAAGSGTGSGPRLRITGMALMGGVDVHRAKPPKELRRA